MSYPYKYPNLYGELAKQGKTKKELADALSITTAGLRYKQRDRWRFLGWGNEKGGSIFEKAN